jgi:hypothetical protein
MTRNVLQWIIIFFKLLKILSFTMQWNMENVSYIYNEYVYEHGYAKFLFIEYYFDYHSHGVSHVTSNNQSLQMSLTY